MSNFAFYIEHNFGLSPFFSDILFVVVVAVSRNMIENLKLIIFRRKKIVSSVFHHTTQLFQFAIGVDGKRRRTNYNEILLNEYENQKYKFKITRL